MITQFDYRGKQFPLYLNGTALFDCYDRFGQEKSLLEVIEPMTAEAFEATIWLLCELSRHGTAYSKYIGLEAPKPLNYAEMMLVTTPADYLSIREAVTKTIYEGFKREHTGEDDTDEWLKEFEHENLKKKNSPRHNIFVRFWHWVFNRRTG